MDFVAGHFEAGEVAGRVGFAAAEYTENVELVGDIVDFELAGEDSVRPDSFLVVVDSTAAAAAAVADALDKRVQRRPRPVSVELVERLLLEPDRQLSGLLLCA